MNTSTCSAWTTSQSNVVWRGRGIYIHPVGFKSLKRYCSPAAYMSLFDTYSPGISTCWSETRRQRLSKQIYSPQSTSSWSRILTSDFPIPPRDKLLACDSKPKTISHTIASAFGVSASTCSAWTTVKRLKSQTHPRGMWFSWRSASIFTHHGKRIRSAIQQGQWRANSASGTLSDRRHEVSRSHSFHSMNVGCTPASGSLSCHPCCDFSCWALGNRPKYHCPLSSPGEGTAAGKGPSRTRRARSGRDGIDYR